MKTNTLSLIMTLLLLSSACGNRAKESNKAVEPEENKTTETSLTEISPVVTKKRLSLLNTFENLHFINLIFPCFP